VGAWACADLLLDINGSLINMKDLNGLTPLGHARANENVDIEKLLISRGAIDE